MTKSYVVYYANGEIFSNDIHCSISSAKKFIKSYIQRENKRLEKPSRFHYDDFYIQEFIMHKADTYRI